MAGTISSTDATVEQVDTAAYKLPTDAPEADGTLSWDSTTLVVVGVTGAGRRGLGYTYADAAAAHLVDRVLSKVIHGRDLFDIPGSWTAMVRAVRNLGRPGVASTAVSAVDAALWDLKARCLDVPLVRLLGAARDGVPVYGSGGFTSYPNARLQKQLADWVADGIPRVKMKVGTHPDEDVERVRCARDAIGPNTELFVDANGAYDRKQALNFAERFAEFQVSWFEEPVSADDLEGLRLLRDRAPALQDIAAGEYGYDPNYFRRMLEAGAVDVLQADATRCGGLTGFLQVDALCQARSLPLSAHCAPALHLAPCSAALSLRHLEYFHDHVRIERQLFDGVRSPIDGDLKPDLSSPGHGLSFKRADAERYLVWSSR
jgi:L-alanine-DL-glutamate epimerase-like enolase superfamily enzyme